MSNGPAKRATVSPARAANLIGRSRDTVVRYLQANLIEGYKSPFNGRWYVYFDSVLRFQERERRDGEFPDPRLT